MFEAWRSRQGRPAQVVFGEDRRRLIASRLRTSGRTAEDLIALIEYAYEADTREARWWRGEEDTSSTTYLGLANLLRREDLSDRVDRALAWRESGKADADRAYAAATDDGDDLGPLAGLRARPAGALPPRRRA